MLAEKLYKRTSCELLTRERKIFSCKGILFALFKEIKLSMLLFMTEKLIFKITMAIFLFCELSGKELNQGLQVLKSLRFYHSPSPA